MSREPTLNELIGEEGTGAERQQLQNVHDMLLEAGPPPELSENLEKGPTLGMTLARQRHRRTVKRRAMVFLAAAILVLMVFVAGYASRSTGGDGKQQAAILQQLKGTPLAPQAQGTLQVWNPQDGTNWPMTLTVVGLRPLAPHKYYEVYLVRNGKPWGSCGTFRVGNSRDSAESSVKVTLSAPYTLQHGDTWVVTKPGGGGSEPGPTVLEPVKA